MGTVRWHWCGSRAARLFAVLGLVVGLAAPVQAQDHKRILLLFDEERTWPGLSLIDQGLRAAFAAGLANNVEFYNESMNRSQFNDDRYELLLRDYYEHKYRDKQLDLVVAVMGPSFGFLQRHGADAFPGVPIVFCGADAADMAGRVLPPNITGLLLKRKFAPTLDIALRLQPDTTKVFVVGGTGHFDRHLLTQARGEFQVFESRVSLTYLTELPLDRLLSMVSQLPPHSIVLFVTLFRDGNGRTFVPHQVVAQISAAANAPVYTSVDQYLGRGTVGGYMYSLELHGKRAAELGLRVLEGESPASLPVQEPASSANMFDARQLARWGLDEGRLPPESMVLFREPSFWDRYRQYIVIAVVVVMAQSALIAGLLVQRSHRRRAETQLRASFDQIRDLGRSLLTAQEDERAHFAREVHDDISQQMAVVQTELRLLAGREDASRLRRELGEIASRAMVVIRGLHALSHRLHPSYLRFVGLTSAIERLRSELSTDRVAIVFSHESVPAAIPPDVKICLFRIAQEALSNAVRHSGAHRIELTLRGDPEGISMTIEDNGSGFELGVAPHGIGLVSMTERVAQVGGTLQVRSSRGGGTQVEARVPWSEDATIEAEAV